MSEIKGIKRAWLAGAVLVVLIVAGDIAARKAGLGGREWMLYLVWALFMVAVFLSTILAPAHRVIVGMSHTLTISFLFALSSWIGSHTGAPADPGSEKGFGVVFALIYVTSFIPALIAAAAALLFSVQKNISLTQERKK